MKKLFMFVVLVIVILVASLLYISHDSNTFIKLSKSDKVFEFEFLWNELKATYPYINLAERMGKSFNNVYKENIEDIKNSKTDIDYLKKLQITINSFNGLGHLSIATPFFYSNYKLLFNELKLKDSELFSSLTPWYNIIHDKEVVHSYSQLDSNTYGFRTTKNLKKDSGEIKSLKPNTNSNLLLAIIEKGKTAYIKVDSFMLNYYDKDKDTLMTFYEDIKDYENLIIDIRDNSGGSDLYWMDLLVAPNIIKKLEHSRYAMFKMTDTVKPYIYSRYDKDSISTIDKLPKFKRLNKEDVKDMTHFIKNTVSIEPINNKFLGNIYVLTSERNYSSSENFAIFCNSTKFADLVGKTTGGDGGDLDPIFIKLPKSKLLVWYSCLYTLNNDGSCNEEFGTTPDYSIKDGEDALSICKEIIKAKIN